jgi:hypothetical protein
VKGDSTPEDMTTTYTDGNDKKYHVNGFIIQLKGGVDSSNLIPIFSKKQIDISGYSTFIIIEFTEEFKEQLRPLKNKQLWKVVNRDTSLTYLRSVPENKRKDIQIPTSSKDYMTQPTSQYPFDKLLHSEKLAQHIDSLNQLLEGITRSNTKDDLSSIVYELYHLEDAKLKAKRTFARKLTYSSYLEDTFIDNNDEPEKLVLSHNEQVEMFSKG